MLQRVWKPVAASVVVGAPAYYYFSRKQSTFDLPVSLRGPDGKRVTEMQKMTLLDWRSAEALLTENAFFHSDTRPPNGLMWKHTTAWMASNNPIEDANAHQIIQRDQSDGDYLFFAVMDGHGGRETSQLLSRILIKATASEIANLSTSSKPGVLASLMGKQASSPRDADPAQMSLAIQKAFENLDSEILKAPLRVLAENMDAESRKLNKIPDISQNPLALQTMLPAISGSCALLAVFDTAHRDLYIACTGDSRAVAGVWEPSADGTGAWRVDVLTEDQTGRNPKELERIRSEHPKDEEPNVVRNGRILGGLEPSRAFGDARYKWPLEIQSVLNQAIMIGSGKPMRNPPNTLKTPPYVIAKPVVTHRKLSFDAPATQGALRFVVLATDGLWDVLSSEDVVSLVGGHLKGLKGSIPKSTLLDLVPTTSSASSTVQGKEARRNQRGESWAFVDENLSTHLIRNALGGADKKAVQELLSIPAPLSRRYRDDITVTVVWWEEGREGQAQLASLKSKL
ncbi:phosphatase 2C-like domain-containing protein [Mycena floridula]|nr:phosphatase 2C-like domain-containing protein [Mycena floridula]